MMDRTNRRRKNPKLLLLLLACVHHRHPHLILFSLPPSLREREKIIMQLRRGLYDDMYSRSNVGGVDGSRALPCGSQTWRTRSDTAPAPQLNILTTSGRRGLHRPLLPLGVDLSNSTVSRARASAIGGIFFFLNNINKHNKKALHWCRIR